MHKIISTIIVGAALIIGCAACNGSSDTKSMVNPSTTTTTVPSTSTSTTVVTSAPVLAPAVAKPVQKSVTTTTSKPKPVVTTTTTITVAAPTTTTTSQVPTTTTTQPRLVFQPTTTTTQLVTTTTNIPYVPRYSICRVDVQTRNTTYSSTNSMDYALIDFYQTNWPKGFTYPGPMTQQQCQDFGKAWADSMSYRFIPGGSFAYKQVN